ncbi:MAG: transcriptional regulator [Alphaproteobacteria bacterium]|nr:transcriptional regulator [Alphaproteobacteria bacterium]
MTDKSGLEKSNNNISQGDMLRMTTEVVSAYVGNNSLPLAKIPDVISSVFGTLRTLDTSYPNGGERPKPAVPIRKSITPDFIVCLEDGKKLKMLKRHLRTNYSMTPEEYRAKWGLNSDYPMVAPNYSAQRSSFAKRIGLGRGRSGPPAS